MKKKKKFTQMTGLIWPLLTWYIIIYLVFIANWAKGKKQPNLRKNIKWKQLRRKKKKGLKCWFNIKSWFDSGWMMNADFIIFTLSSTVENFQKGCFPALHQLYWPTFLQRFEQKLVEGLKIKRTTRNEESEFLSRGLCIHVCQFYVKEAVLPSP